MTRKDYELIAAALKRALEDNPEWLEYRDGVRASVAAVADALASDNPRFDRARFLKACGVA